MSKDIRSFFSVGAKSKKPDTPKPSPQQAAPKRKAIVYSDDEEPEKERKQLEVAEKPSSLNKKRRVIDSDDEEKTSPVKSKKSSSSSGSVGSSKLKPVSAADVFSSAPVKRIETPRPSKKAIKEEIEIHSDDEFEKTLIGLDDSGVVPETPKATKNGKDKISPAKKEKDERKTNGHGDHREKVITTDKKREEKRKDTPEKKREEKRKHTPEKKREEKKDTPEKKREEKRKETPEKVKSQSSEKKKEKPVLSKDSSTEESTTPKASKKNLNESVLSDEERHERKRMSAMLYQKFKNRAGPSNPGSKEIPKGKPNCLLGLQFVVTGVLDSLERDECAQIIKDFGGKVVSSVTKKVTHMVIGEEAGPSKLAKAEEFGIPQLSEDAFLDLIRERSGLPTTGVPKRDSSTKASVKEEKSPSKEKKRKKTDEPVPNKRTPEKKPSESNSTLPKVPKIPKLEKSSPEKSKISKMESKSPEKKPQVASPTKRAESAYEKDIHSTDNMAWVDKYKPTSVKQIIGQTGASSNVQKLTNWLSKWHSNQDGKKKIPRPNPWAKNDDGSYYRAALLSGPPGVGKTTTATLVCKELGFDAVEFNASDTRSKKLLKEEVSELLSNKSLFGYFTGSGKKGEMVTNKHVLIMDEVDGMAGNEDRGGIQELIGLIKESHVPIICMCNDRNHQKMRSLVNYCYDLKFSKPRVEQIKGAMMSVCFKEGLKLAPGALEEIIAGTGGDIRQTLNHLAMYSAGKASGLSLSLDKAKQGADSARKDVKLGPWEVIRKVFSAEDHKNMSIHDKSDLFFHDYSLAPLFVQENYLKVTPKVPKTQVMDQIALTADSLSRGDMVDRRIRSNMAWSLLPLQAMYTSVLPGEYMEGFFSGQINFPGWLGKNSKATKRKRLAQEIHDHTRTCTSGSRLSVRLDYAPYLLDAIVRPLKENGSDGVAESLGVIRDYHLLREDLESLVELTSWPKKKSPMESVDGKVKAALTRAYNKEIAPYSYSVVNAVKKKKAEAAEEAAAEMYGEDDEINNAAVESEEDKDDDDMENNAFIKVKKKPAGKGAAAASAAGSSKASGSKPKGTTSTKGKKK
ncbi:replication factor C subunit 1 [Topomyia yanbarensis]|uniref:replication factor C subunit 1 n=1 Tax=Topomyia yanbarensis TaxID=2498891 RepID=UPI00273B4A67|nr:replication factor C subunit 1 [Topomyia yanbarensis]XP_058825425.1 replication factor C subunit 1 [Topomyia yanbarensis]